MFKYWADVFSQALTGYFEVNGQTPRIFLIGAFAVVSGWVFAWLRRGPEGMKLNLQAFLDALPGAVFVFLVILAWQMAHVPYTQFRAQESVANSALQEKDKLEATLAQKRQSLDSTDPAFHNMLDTIRAFMKYRRAVAPEQNCWILVTAPPDDGGLAGLVVQFAVVGSNCPNGNLQNLGVPPQDVAAIERKGMIPGKVVLHALAHTKGADGLVDDLGNLFQVQRSYEMPASTVPPNVIWLQFGTGAKWNTELYGQVAKR